MEQPMRDLSVSDSQSDSSSSPPQPPMNAWTHAMSSSDVNLQFSTMTYPFSTPSATTNPFDFSSGSTSSSTSSTQHYNLYPNSLAGYSSWPYSAAYGLPYQGMYDGFKEMTANNSTAVASAAGSSSASTPAHFPNWAVSHEGKKKRQPYKKDQISRLEYEYSVNSYLTNKRRAELSKQLMLDEKQVKVWFQNRRMKDKKLRQRVTGPFPHGAPVMPCVERLIN